MGIIYIYTMEQAEMDIINMTDYLWKQGYSLLESQNLAEVYVEYTETELIDMGFFLID